MYARMEWLVVDIPGSLGYGLSGLESKVGRGQEVNFEAPNLRR